MYQPPELPVELLEDGDSVELWRPPQGGHVIVIGARVRGLDSDFIRLRARVRNPETGLIVAEENTSVTMEDVAGEPGLKQTDRRTNTMAAHVALCPDLWDRDIVDKEQWLEVHVTELYADFSTGEAQVTVIPRCLQSDPRQNERCYCECTANYVLTRCTTPRDAGADSAP